MLNKNKPNVISFRPAVQVSPTIINTANLKYMCEVCGFQAGNIDSLRMHLTEHNGKQLPGDLQSKLALIFNTNLVFYALISLYYRI